MQNQISFLSFSLVKKGFLTLQTPSSHSKPPTHVIFSLILSQITWYVSLIPHSSCISCIRPRFLGFCEIFGVFEKFWDFCEIFGLGVAYLMLYDYALHSIYNFTIFHAFRCVFICWKLCADRFGLGWTHDAISFAYHMFMHFSCIRTLSFLSFGTLLWWCFSICLPLSLS